MKSYSRDYRSPLPFNEATSKVMSANKGKNTNPEIQIRKALWKNNIKGYRLNHNKVPGKPDIVFVSKKLAIFVHGCYWHRCPTCNLSIPKSNSMFWKDKFEKNKERDNRKTEELIRLGWNVLVVWECEIKMDLKTQIDKIRMAL